MKKNNRIYVIVGAVLFFAVSFGFGYLTSRLLHSGSGNTVSTGELTKPNSYYTLSMDQLVAYKSWGVNLIYVGNENEYRKTHFTTSEYISWGDLDSGETDRVSSDLERFLFVISETGEKSRKACEKLLDMGFVNVFDCGGMDQMCDSALYVSGKDEGTFPAGYPTTMIPMEYFEEAAYYDVDEPREG